MCWKFWICTVFNIFHRSGFLNNLHLSWNKSLPWKFSLYRIDIFYHSGFLSNLRLPWKQSCPEIFDFIEMFFIIQDFWATCAFPENRVYPEISHCIAHTFYIQDFWATWACCENRVDLKLFTVLKYFLSFRIFEQLALALKTEFALKIFKPVGAAAPLPRTPV